MTDFGALASALEGSPYTLPDDAAGRDSLASLVAKAEDVEKRCLVVRQGITAEFTARVSNASRAREIYESNAIEGKQATLAETYSILDSRRMWSADTAMARYALGEALRDEPKVQDVVGLAAARILVDQYTQDADRPIAEADLRDMHSLILSGHRSAGQYKQYLNSIEGSTHTPMPPVDVPAAMDAMVRWVRESEAPLLWRSAVAHAWLTHIHPFDDGNGRMARLFANYLLGFGCYPPLIVKSTADRGKYISALGHSDQAGDIIPLVRVFGRALTRQLKFMEDPGFAWSLFQKDLLAREDSLYKRWHTTLDRFLSEVAAHLRLSGKSLEVITYVGASDFELLRKRDSSGNGWLAKVRAPGMQRDLLLWVGHTSDAAQRRLEEDQVFPSLFISERDANPKATRAYLSRVRGLPPLNDEVCIIADENKALVRRGDNSRMAGLPQAAELWAALLSNYLDSMARD